MCLKCLELLLQDAIKLFVNELKHLKDLSRVIFLAQGWNELEIDELIKKGINYFTVDNETDLDCLLLFLEKNGL